MLRLCHLGLASSAAGLVALSLLSGVEAAPFLWLLATLPAYGFCFLPLAQAVLWTGVSGLLIVLLNLVGKILTWQPEFVPGPVEKCGYQLLLLFLVTLISAVVKALGVKHVRAVKRAKFEAELASATRTRFTAHVSHEMRHPLQSIVGALELAETDQLNQDQSHLFRQAKRDARMLCHLVDSTLLFADLCQGRFVSEPEPVTLEQIEESILGRYATRFRERGIVLDLDFEDVPSLILERTAVEHLIGVFLDNALQYTDTGDSVQVRMRVESDRLRVFVQDTGKGISAGVLEQLHEPYLRGEEIQNRTERGFGLGLAIVHKLTETLGGHWGVESELGKGSLFWYEVPCSTSVVNRPLKETLLSILVVDDDPTCLTVTRRLLEKLGHKVVTVSRAEQIEQLVASDDFDLVFMDCNMPGIDGFQATRLLRGWGFNEPILALTANTSSSDRERCRDSGMNAVIPKPVTQAKLLRALTDFF